MLFYSSKKPVELQIIHLNKAQETAKKQLADAQKEEKSGCTPFAKICQAIKKSKEDKKSDDKEALHSEKKNVYVLDFDGDIKASAVEHLREEISTTISSAKAGDEIVLRLESGGGQVNAYGLAAAQLMRIKQAGLSLTVCVDKIAASGGYMMACVADKIIASDFGVIGSVGVISQLPNFHELMKKYDIGFEQFTAGEYKRTVTMFGENTDEDRQKHQEDINRIHELFKQFVKTHRPNLNIEAIATGEIWLGADAMQMGLIDEVGTSDSYILSLLNHHHVYALHTRSKPTLMEKLGLSDSGLSVQGVVEHTIQALGQAASKFTRP